MATKKQPPKKQSTAHILIELAALLLVLVVCVVMIVHNLSKKPEAPQTDPTQNTPSSTDTSGDTQKPEDLTPEGIKQAFFQTHGLTEADYLDGMFEAYEYFPEARDFILNYPLKKDSAPAASDISGYDRTKGVPLFLQWDDAWGYTPYAKGVCGISGCGPVSLSMVAYYLTGNPEYTPQYMMKFAQDNKYVGDSGGTNWTLFNKGAVKLGFDVKEVPLDENAIRRKLEAGIPVVVNVGPGDFTRNGHYMVLVGYEDGMIRINDPFSKINSEKLWSYERIKDQIKNLWAISL